MSINAKIGITWAIMRVYIFLSYLLIVIQVIRSQPKSGGPIQGDHQSGKTGKSGKNQGIFSAKLKSGKNQGISKFEGKSGKNQGI